jgi:hypothetical protein
MANGVPASTMARWMRRRSNDPRPSAVVDVSTKSTWHTHGQCTPGIGRHERAAAVPTSFFGGVTLDMRRSFAGPLKRR